MSVESRENSSFQVAKKREKKREKRETHHVSETLFPKDKLSRASVAPTKAPQNLDFYVLIRQIRSIQDMPIKFKISSEDPSAVLTRCCFCCQVKSPRNLSPRRSLFIYLDPVGPVKLGQEELLAIEISLQTPREHIMRYIFNQSSPASYLPNKNKLVLEHPDTESENTN
ncbi:hypothetical protein R3P38DRAFT_2793585 [Favolaschia claudopus]|uniref:Uncharacterized protein n=1 Tax=Favolaschia claudopus TaxID=2862362 RepID=A0AAW0AD25_9AGAR